MTVIGLTGEQHMISRNGKILRCEDASYYIDARQILTNAQAEAARMIDAAQQEIAQQRLDGFRAGVKEGQQEQAKIILETIVNRDAYLVNAEPELCNLLIAAVRKIFADFDDGEKTRIIVHKALSGLRAQTQVVIRVHPQQYDTMKREVSNFRTIFPNLELLEILADDTIDECACVMSSELGAIKTSIETQIEALAAAISATLKPSTTNGEVEHTSSSLPDSQDDFLKLS